MLAISDAHVHECLEQAEHCLRQAAAQCDPGLQADFRLMESRWRSLARSHVFAQRLLRAAAVSPANAAIGA